MSSVILRTGPQPRKHLLERELEELPKEKPLFWGNQSWCRPACLPCFQPLLKHQGGPLFHCDALSVSSRHFLKEVSTAPHQNWFIKVTDGKIDHSVQWLGTRECIPSLLHPPRGIWQYLEDIFFPLSVMTGERILPAPGMLLNILQCIGQLLEQRVSMSTCQ